MIVSNRGAFAVPAEFNIATRACILRAVHTRQQELMSEMERLSQLLDTGANDEATRVNLRLVLQNVRDEIQCLHEGVQQIWRGEISNE